jgi:hypothetical protein
MSTIVTLVRERERGATLRQLVASQSTAAEPSIPREEAE